MRTDQQWLYVCRPELKNTEIFGPLNVLDFHEQVMISVEIRWIPVRLKGIFSARYKIVAFSKFTFYIPNFW